MPAKHMTGAAIVLTLFAIAGTGMVALTYEGTKPQIAENERQALLDNLYTLVPKARLDNDIFNDTTQVQAPQMLGTTAPITVYRARKAGQPVAAVFTAIAPDGYSGNIRILVGVNADGTLAGVRVLSHKETPGLGDPIEVEKSDWILGFDGLSLTNPSEEQWKVKKDGGVFDQFTGATITPRAVVGAVHRALTFFQENKHQLFAPKQTAEAS